jgi:metallo-beta-lactamase superfamily protein
MVAGVVPGETRGTVFTIQMLPARQGDALLVEYGPADAPRRILLDGGTPGTKTDLRARLLELGPPPLTFELLVITHVDGDHIGGVLEMLEDDPAIAAFGDVWFNAWRHLPGNENDFFGPVQGERLTGWLDANGAAWNAGFGNAAAAVAEAGALPEFDLADDMHVTVVTPGPGELAELRPVWEAEVRAAGLEPGVPFDEIFEVPFSAVPFAGVPTRAEVEAMAATAFESDDSEANGASISLLLEHDGRSALLTGDAHSDPLVRGVTRLLEARGIDRLEVDVFKLPHHGSQRNVSVELLELVHARSYLFSTNGSSFGHPDPEAVARVALKAAGSRLCFNYADRAGVWSEPSLMGELGYSILVPGEGRLTVPI